MVFKKLLKITPDPFALDLSDRSIKIAKLSKSRDGFVLEKFSETAIKEGLLKDGEIVSGGELARLIARPVLSFNAEGRYVSCSLPEQKSFLRVIQLPRAKEEEIRDAIRWEVEANIPMRLDEVYFDWQILPPLYDKIKHFDILVSAAPRDLVDSYIKLFADAGLKPISFEMESLATARCLIKGGLSEQPVLIVDLGRSGTNFIIYAGHGIRLASYSQISGDTITENMSRDLKIDFKQAEKLKKEVGFSAQGGFQPEADGPKDQSSGLSLENKKVFEASVPIMTDLKQQIKKYLDFYSGHKSHVHDGKPGISKILLCGGGAKLKGIEEYLSSSLGIPVETGDPFTNVKRPSSQKGEFVKYTTAIGLSL